MRSLSIDLSKFEVVVNRFDKSSVLTLAKLNKNLEIKIANTIPQDTATVVLANNLGVPFAIEQKNLSISKSIVILANYLLTRDNKKQLHRDIQGSNHISKRIRKKKEVEA